LEEGLDRIFEGRHHAYFHLLADDWRFDAIEREANDLPGHEYEDRNHVGEFIVSAIHDLEAAFRQFHPAAPAKQVADFWRSWQVHKHIAEFCLTPWVSEAAERLAQCNGAVHGDSARMRVESARLRICRRLVAFAHTIEQMADRSRATETQSPSSEIFAMTTEQLVTSRSVLLDEYKAATGIKSSAQIYGARKDHSMHKAQFYQWKNGGLSSDSVTAKAFEAFLERKKLPRRSQS